MAPEPEDSPAPSVPIIDLSETDDELLVKQIASACMEPGFFQVIHHGIPQTLLQNFREQCQLYFNASREMKLATKRNAGNARGYFDDELTKQKRDWKECLDVGTPGSRDWDLPDEDPRNACLDGYNQFLPSELLADHRRVTVEYFEACAELSHRLSVLMARGLGKDENDPFLVDLKKNHTSYLRTNYYPPCQDPQAPDNPLGISPHKDAGFVTVLLQDDDCHSLQVPDTNGNWMTVRPVPGAVTINTGDMAQIWSNNRYHAPLHRVLTNSSKPRYSAPFFYNPGYKWLVEPSVEQESPQYHPLLWGYFRALRFAGDLTDLGVEIQIQDFAVDDQESHHLRKQKLFLEQGLTDQPFDVEACRDLLVEDSQ